MSVGLSFRLIFSVGIKVSLKKESNFVAKRTSFAAELYSFAAELYSFAALLFLVSVLLFLFVGKLGRFSAFCLIMREN